MSTNPPYVSFTSFERLLAFWSTDGLPRTLTWELAPSFGMSLIAQLRHAIRALELVYLEDAPTPLLKALVASKEGSEARRLSFVKIRETSYDFVTDEMLLDGSPSELDELFASAGGSTGTRERALRFFLRLCDAAHVEIGPRLRHGRKAEGEPDQPASARSFPRHRAAAFRLAHSMLEKFPDFNEDWPASTKESWMRELGDIHRSTRR